MKGSYQLLSRHGDADLVAISVTERWTARDLRRHAATLALQLPPGREGAEALVLCADRYCFAVSALAAWEAGYSIALPPNAQPETVRDYTVTCRKPGEHGAVTLAAVTGNYQRLRRHQFAPVEAHAVRIHVTATNGDEFARIFEVRCYG